MPSFEDYGPLDGLQQRGSVVLSKPYQPPQDDPLGWNKLYEAKSPFDDIFEAAEERQGLPAGILKRLAITESSLNPKAHNKKDGGTGSYGLMQINSQHLNAPVDLSDPTGVMNPEVNINLGAGRLADLRKKVGGDLQRALGRYKGVGSEKGRANVDKAMRFVLGDEYDENRTGFDDSVVVSRTGWQAPAPRKPSFDDYGPMSEKSWLGKALDKAGEDAITFGKGTASIANFLGSLPSFFVGTAAGVGASAVGALAGETPREAFASGAKIGTHVGEVVDKYINPVNIALRAFNAETSLDETVVNKGMNALTSAIKDYSRHVERSTGNKIPAEGIEMLVNTAMVAYGGKARDVVIDRGLPYRKSYTELASDLAAKPTEAPKPTFEQYAPIPEGKGPKYQRGMADWEKMGWAGAAGGAAIVGQKLYQNYQDYGILFPSLQEPTKRPGGVVPQEEREQTPAPLDEKGERYLAEGAATLGGLAAIGAGVVKGKGGNWVGDAVTTLAKPMYPSPAMLEQLPIAKRAPVLAFIKNHTDRMVSSYLNKHAGTATDPLRDIEVPFKDRTLRWEDLTDTALDKITVGQLRASAANHGYRGERLYPNAPESEVMWTIAAPVRRGRLGYIDSPQAVASTALTSYLSHAADYARQNIPPEKLGQYDLVRLVKETKANDVRVAKEMERATLSSMKDMPIYKDYGDGMKWVELKIPEKLTEEQAKLVRIGTANDFQVAEDATSRKHFASGQPLYIALDIKGDPIRNNYTDRPAYGRTPEEAYFAGLVAQEGNQMGHSVGGYGQVGPYGQGGIEAVAAGNVKLYSLRDAKGGSHATVEVAPSHPRTNLDPFRRAFLNDRGRKVHEEQLQDNILQIKGKSNLAPTAKYQPYVQDFVRGGKWGEVGDLQNTGLTKLPDGRYLTQQEGYRETLIELDKKITEVGATPELLAYRERVNNLLEDPIPLSRARGQQGSADPRFLTALAIAGVGATAGAAMVPSDRLTAALVGGTIALGSIMGTAGFGKLLGNNKLSRQVERAITASTEQFIRAVNPDLLGKKAEAAASVLGTNYVQMMRRQLAIEASSEKRSRWWTSLGDAAGREFLIGMERGTINAQKYPQLATMVQQYRDWMDAIFRKDQAKGIEYDPVSNYIYHAFEDPKGAADFLYRKYGLKFGDPKFSKERTSTFFDEAEQAGFKLKTYNPEQLMVMRQHASDIAHLKVDALRDFEKYGLARKLGKGDELWQGEYLWRSPNGERYALLDQPNQVMHNAFNTVSLWSDPGALGIAFRGVSYMKNVIVPINLFGLFHPLHVQLGMSWADPMQNMTKRWAGGKAGFTDFVQELVTKGALLDIVSAPLHGWEMMKAYRGDIPEAKLTEVQRHALFLMEEGTFNPTMAIEYRNKHMRDFRDAIASWKNSPILGTGKATWALPFAMMETFYTKPIFEQWIPAVKTAAFLRGAYATLEANPQLLANPLEMKNALRKVAKRIDDRFGEVQYKTLFMTRWVKDSAVMSFLSYGWQLGFVRSYVGAIPELAKGVSSIGKGSELPAARLPPTVEVPLLDLYRQAAKAGKSDRIVSADIAMEIREGKTLRAKVARGELDKALFVSYYVMGTMLYGGLLTYALTGTTPKDVMDYIFPKTGQKNADGTDARVSTPFYTREFVSIPKHIQEEGVAKGLGITVANKLSPAIGMIKAIATNHDFFNREISDPNAPALTRLGQRLKYIATALTPISISGAERGPPGIKTQVLSGLGFTPAPVYVTQTPMEAKISHTFRAGRQNITPFERVAYGQKVHELYRLRQEGNRVEFALKLRRLKAEYKLNPGQVELIKRNSQIPAPERMFKQLNEAQQLRLLKEMSPAERKRFRPFARAKLKSGDIYK